MFSKEAYETDYLNWLLERVSADHDGTIADSRTAVADEFNNIFKTSYRGPDIYTWDSVVGWCLAMGMKIDEAREVNRKLWYEPDTIFKAEPMPGAIEFLEGVTGRKSDLLINSSRNPDLYESTVEWYKVHAPFIRPEQIRVSLPDVLERPLSKALTVRLTGRRMHLEDVPEHAKYVLDYTDAHVFLFSNSSRLKGYFYPKLHQIETQNGNPPSLEPLNRLFFG